MEVGDRSSGLRLSELVAAFSLATDLGLGQPTDHVIRSWAIASELASLAEVGDVDRADLYYVVMLAWVGCVADTPEVAAWFGDDIAFRRDSYDVDLTGLPMLGFSLRRAGSSRSLAGRLGTVAELVATGGRPVQQGLMSHCLTTARMAEGLGLSEGVGTQLQQVFARWDGRGVPARVGGEEIAPAVRLFHLADVVEVWHRARGVAGAVEVARARRGTQFDPAVVDAFCAGAAHVLGAADEADDWEARIREESALRRMLSEAELDSALEVIGDFTDLRSPSRAGHSRGVARLAATAAGLLGLPESDVRLLHRAGLVHDVGTHAVPATVLEHPGPLGRVGAERMRLHAYCTERILARPASLARIGAVASLATERLDGSGYHRGLSGPAIPLVGRILAAADVFHAMREPRPYRPSLDARAATRELRREVHAGRLDGDAVDAVLAAAGQRTGRVTGPAGLTAREIEVLRLIARGATTRQVARVLGIRPRTAGTHVEHIYTKIGASSRSTATLFAMRHGLLDTLEPLEP